MSQPTADSLKALDARIAELRAQNKDVSALEQKRAEDAAALKAKSSDDVGLLDPKNKEEAEAAKTGRDAADSVAGAFGAVKDAASDGVSAISDAVGGLFGGDDSEGSGDDKGKKGKFKWGNTIAGIVGVIVAYLASSLFGGGILGTIMFALFAIPAFMMGRSQLGNWFSGMFGEEPTQKTDGQASALNVAQSQSQTVAGAPDQQQLVNGAVPQVPPPLTPHQKLQAEVMEVAQKSQIARATLIQQVQSGEIDPRRANTMMQQVGRAEMALNQMQGVDINRLNPDQLRAIGREFEMAEGALDRTINSNPIIAAQIQQSFGPSPVAADPAIAQYYQQNHGRVGVAMANPQVLATNLPPQAQQQLMAMRQSNPHYHYQPAQQGAPVPQHFTGLPEQQPFMLPDAYIPR